IAFADMVRDAIGRGLAVVPVDRRALDEVIKEQQRSKSSLFEPATAQRMGKLSGADSIVRGNFQKIGNEMRVTAEVVDVGTGLRRASAVADGTFTGLFKLQTDLAARLVIEMKGVPVDPPSSATSVEALRAFSEGVSLYRNDLFSDALTLFD